MAGILKAIVIEPGCDPEVVEMDTSLRKLQAAVGGWLEAVYGYNDEGFVAAIFLCNEEGKLLGLPVNVAATNLWWDMNQNVMDRLCGPVIVLGPPDENGNETSVPDHVIAML